MSQTIQDFKDLTSPQLKVLSFVERDKEFTNVFFLTGGTLLKALGIVPRTSNDLDFFTFSHITSHEFLTAQLHIRDFLEGLFGPSAITVTDKGFLHRDSGMVIDIVADGSPAIGDFEFFGNLKTAHLKDLAAHKASALCSRDEIKDYIDIAFLTKQEGWLLQDLAQFGEEKFRLGTISEEKLLTELLAKRDTFPVPSAIFLRSPEENIQTVTDQVNKLIEHTSL